MSVRDNLKDNEKTEVAQLTEKVSLIRSGKIRMLSISEETTGSNGHFTTFVIPENDRPNIPVRSFGFSVTQGYIDLTIDPSGAVYTLRRPNGNASIQNASGNIIASSMWLVD